jgi:hypothetical protein
LPLLEKDYRRWKGYAPYPTIFTDYLQALACTKRLEEVRQFWQKIKAIEPEIPDRLNKRARRKIKENMQRGFENVARVLVQHLSRDAHLTVEQINDLLVLDIKNDETFKYSRFWDWNPEFDKPKYKNWERHLGELAEYYKKHPLPELMELLKREKDEEFGVRFVNGVRFVKMPGIETHHAEPLRRKLRDYVYSYKYPESAGRLRIEADVSDIELRYDLVYKVGTSQAEKIAFLLDHLGLEVVEVNEPRRVWIARHDGRELKDYKDVKAPGKVMAMSSSGLDLSYLFRTLMDHQNRDVKANGPVVIDQTGLTDRVSLEGPCFEGEEGLEIARKWFNEEIGVTFTEERRIMTTYVIRRQ